MLPAVLPRAQAGLVSLAGSTDEAGGWGQPQCWPKMCCSETVATGPHPARAAESVPQIPRMTWN